MTIKELIDKLSTYPGDWKVRIIDADTSWFIDKPIFSAPGDSALYYIETQPETLFIWGDYSDMSQS